MFKRILMMLLLLPGIVFASPFEAGKDYELLPAQNLPVENKIKVIEFFSYGCPWCYKIEAALETWVKNQENKIIFERVPVVFNKSWENYAKAFYTAKTLSIIDKFNPLLFKAIQTFKQTLNTNQSMIDFFVNNGVDKALATSAFEHSLTVDMMVKQGMAQMAQYQVNVVPSFVINHRYKTDLQMAKDPERLIEILNYLVSLESKS